MSEVLWVRDIARPRRWCLVLAEPADVTARTVRGVAAACGHRPKHDVWLRRMRPGTPGLGAQCFDCASLAAYEARVAAGRPHPVDQLLEQRGERPWREA